MYLLFPSGGSSENSSSITERAEVLLNVIRAIVAEGNNLPISSDDEEGEVERDIEEGEIIP